MFSCSDIVVQSESFRFKLLKTRRGGLNLTCSIARPRGATTPKPQECLPGRAVEELPVWPSDDALNDRNLFYVVEESELQNTYWIRTYLDLAVDAVDMSLTPSDLSKLEIVKVAIQTKEDVEPPNERLNAKNAIVYISFKGLAIRGTGEHVERKVIVRRVIDERTGYLSLRGELLKREEDLIPTKRREDNEFYPSYAKHSAPIDYMDWV